MAGRSKRKQEEELNLDTLGDQEVRSETSEQTGSQNSASSINSAVVRLGTAPINSLVWGSSIVYLIGSFAECLYYLTEVIMVGGFAGLDGLNALVAFRPLEALLCRNVFSSLSSAAGSLASSYLSKSRTGHAVRAFNHWIWLIAIWTVFLEIVFVPTLQPIYKSILGDTGVRQGLLWGYIVIGGATPFVGLAYTCGPFLEAENREFLASVRQILWSVLAITLVAFFNHLYDNADHAETDALTPLANMGLAYLVTNIIIFVWMLLVFFRVDVLDMRIRGTLKFSVHGLWPLSGKMLKNIVLTALTNYVSSSVQQICMVITLSFMPMLYTNTNELMGVRASMMYYLIIYHLCSSITDGFVRGFSVVVTYNIANRFYGRVRHIIVATALWQFLLSLAFCLIMMIASNALFASLVPGGLEDSENFDAYSAFTERGGTAVLLGALTSGLMGGFEMVGVLLLAEHRNTLLILLKLARVVGCLVTVLTTQFVIVDGCEVLYGFAFGDVVPIVSGYLYLIYYIYKYNHLSDIEEARKAKSELEAQLANIKDVDDADDPYDPAGGEHGSKWDAMALAASGGGPDDEEEEEEERALRKARGMAVAADGTVEGSLGQLDAPGAREEARELY